MANGIVWEFKKSGSLSLEIAESQSGLTAIIKNGRTTKPLFKLPNHRNDMTREDAILCMLHTLIILRLYLIIPEGIKGSQVKHLLKAIEEKYFSRDNQYA